MLLLWKDETHIFLRVEGSFQIIIYHLTTDLQTLMCTFVRIALLLNITLIQGEMKFHAILETFLVSSKPKELAWVNKFSYTTLPKSRPKILLCPSY